jgi:hypothetical protein
MIAQWILDMAAHQADGGSLHVGKLFLKLLDAKLEEADVLSCVYGASLVEHMFDYHRDTLGSIIPGFRCEVKQLPWVAFGDRLQLSSEVEDHLETAQVLSYNDCIRGLGNSLCIHPQFHHKHVHHHMMHKHDRDQVAMSFHLEAHHRCNTHSQTSRCMLPQTLSSVHEDLCDDHAQLLLLSWRSLSQMRCAMLVVYVVLVDLFPFSYLCWTFFHTLLASRLSFLSSD